MKFLSKNAVGAAALLAALSGSAFGQANQCASATLITPGIYSGTTVGATVDGNGGCGISQATADVWFRIVAPSDRQLVVTTCGGAAWDTVLSIHSGCPGDQNNALGCNDDDNSCGTQSTVGATVASGQTYLIRVSGYSGATGQFTIRVSFEEPPPPPSLGPDVWIEDLIDISYDGTAGGINAYAVGTDACNQGDAPAEWQSSNNRHPVIAQNLFRLKAGRFEQIGQSWLKHGFASTNSGACGTCQQPPGGSSQLGPNCSDAYGSGLNGDQGNLGPRSQVNASTGVFTYPYTAPGFTGAIARRLQVKATDLTPAQNPGALYFAECHYITQDDAQWNNGLNNASYKQVSMSAPTNPVFSGATVRQQAAIMAWPANDSGVTVSNLDYAERGVAPGSLITARFILASKATDNGNDTFTYEYAVENFNSDRAGGSFSIPLPAGAHVLSSSFHDVDVHSGEPYSTTDWTATVGAYDITWNTQAFQQNANANALRWGTLYNFRFTTDVPPAPGAGTATLGLFKPAPAGSYSVALFGEAAAPDLARCIGDFNNDGGFDGADVSAFFAAWEAGAAAADTNADGGVDGQDAEVFFTRWEGGQC